MLAAEKTTSAVEEELNSAVAPDLPVMILLPPPPPPSAAGITEGTTIRESAVLGMEPELHYARLSTLHPSLLV